MKIHVTAKQSDGREWFTHISVVEKEGRFYIAHHSMPMNVEEIKNATPEDSSGSVLVKHLNPIGTEVNVIKAIESYIHSRAGGCLSSYVSGYLASKGLSGYNLIEGRQR